MSVHASAWVWGIAEAANLSATELLVMLALAEHATPAGWSYPSQKRVAQMTRLTERTVRRICEELEGRDLGDPEAPLLRRFARYREGGLQSSNGYQFSMQAPPQTPDTGSAPGGSCDLPGRTQGSARGGHRDPPMNPSLTVSEIARRPPPPAWPAAVAALEQEISAGDFGRWVRAATAHATPSGVVVLVWNELVREWWAEHGVADLVAKALADAGASTRVRVIVGSADDDREAAA